VSALLYDWFIGVPADFIAFFVLISFILGPLIAVYAAWFYTVYVLDGTKTGRPTRTRTYFIAGIIS
jgi:hypothetical protein